MTLASGGAPRAMVPTTATGTPGGGPTGPARPFVAEVEAIRARARVDLAQGAVTPSYGADRATVLAFLNGALATELVCVLRYRRHHFMASGIHSHATAAEFLVHSNEEQGHADQLAERIVQLGGEPDFSPDSLTRRSHAEYVEGVTLSEMIRENLVAERIAIDSYRHAIDSLGNDDPTTRRLLESILAVEEEHADELATCSASTDRRRPRPFRAAAPALVRRRARSLARPIGSAEDHPDPMTPAVVDQRHGTRGRQHHAIEGHAGHAVALAGGILDPDLVGGVLVAERDVEARPRRRDAGCDRQLVAAHPEPEHRFEAGAIQPARRTGVPGPATAPDVRRHRIDIGAGDIGLDLVAVALGARAGVADRVECGEQFGRPRRRRASRSAITVQVADVRVLAAVLADARRVALDVARIRRRPSNGGVNSSTNPCAGRKQLRGSRLHEITTAEVAAGGQAVDLLLGHRGLRWLRCRRILGRVTKACRFAPTIAPMNFHAPTALAAIDMGSNSFRLEIAELPRGRYKRIEYLKETVRLGAGLDAEGMLTEAAMQRGLDCLRRFASRLQGFAPARVRAVATQTLREARNRNAFLARAQEALGYPIEVISGREEARLIYAGVARLQASDEPRLVIDIGGRSTEMILGRGREPLPPNRSRSAASAFRCASSPTGSSPPRPSAPRRWRLAPNWKRR